MPRHQAAQPAQQTRILGVAAAAQQVAVGNDAQHAPLVVDDNHAALVAAFQRAHDLFEPGIRPHGGHILVHQLVDRSPQARGHRLDLIALLVIFHRAQHVDTADKADQPAVTIDHGQALQGMLGHQGGSLAHLVVRMHGDHRHGHDGLSRMRAALEGSQLHLHLFGRQLILQAKPCQQTGAPHQVAVGDDAHQLALFVDDRQAAIPALHKQGNEIGHRRGGAHGGDAAAHDGTHRLIERLDRAAGSVLYDLDLLARDHAVVHHGAHDRQNAFDLLVVIDPLHADGQRSRQVGQGSCPHTAVGAEPRQAALRSCARRAFSAQHLEQG